MRLLTTEDRVAAVPSDSDHARCDHLSLADLARWPIAINTVSGTTHLDLWPPHVAPAGVVEVANTDDWLAAITAGTAVGVTSTATVAMYPHPGVTYVPLTDAPALRLCVAWREPATHPAVPALVTLLRTLFRPSRPD